MKISRLYSNKNFKNIKFNLIGLNVVLGNIYDPKNLETDSHNLGKSVLIKVIDFILLKEINDKSKFFLTKGNFSGQVFYGEFALNDGRFILIKRDVDQQSKISLKINAERLNAFDMNIDWDEEELPIRKAKDIVNNSLGFTVFKKWNYRKSINYFLRHQHDYQDLFKLSKFRGQDKDWKPFIFDLLGFNGNIISEKYQKSEKKLMLKTKVKILESEADIQIEEKDRILGLIEIKKEERDQIESVIDQFDFSNQEEEINENIVENIEEELQVLHSQKYFLSLENSKIRKSLNEKNLTVDVVKLGKLFDEISVVFPNQIIDDFTRLINFNKEVTEERNGILQTTFEKNENDLEQINIQIELLNTDKVSKLNYLTEYDTYKKFKQHQKELSKIEADIIYLEKKYKIIDDSSNIVEEIEELDDQINKLIKSTHDEISKQKHKNIRKIFNAILKEILNTNAILSIKQNKEGNVEFNANIQKPADLTITEEDFGTSYKKLMCIAFDLALLENYSTTSFYRFAYHDGALEALDNRKKNTFLNVSRSKCYENNLQHIITLIDTDIPRDNTFNPIPFEKDEVILNLNDKDESGVLFEKYF
ncbi:MAG: DUF2326 domain-containing protein [Bacteroidetes bacterium]|nr:DUF2326 domain-containing protein [Bacteroidota bacterium]